MVLGFETFALRFAGGDVSDFFDSALLPGTGRFAAHVIGLVFAIILARYLYRRKIFLRV
jgi:membrane associated rhomboid family serine protease